MISIKWRHLWLFLLLELSLFFTVWSQDTSEPLDLESLIVTGFQGIFDIFNDFLFGFIGDALDQVTDIFDGIGAGDLLDEGVGKTEEIFSNMGLHIDVAVPHLEEYADDFKAKLDDIEEILSPLLPIFAKTCPTEEEFGQGIAAAQQKVLEKNRQMNIQEDCLDQLFFLVTFVVTGDISAGFKFLKVTGSLGIEVDAGISFPCQRFVFTFSPYVGVATSLKFGTPHGQQNPLHPNLKKMDIMEVNPEQHNHQKPKVVPTATFNLKRFLKDTALTINLGLAIAWNPDETVSLQAQGLVMPFSVTLPSGLLGPIPLSSIGVVAGMGEPRCPGFVLGNFLISMLTIGFATFPAPEIFSFWKKTFGNFKAFAASPKAGLSGIKTRFSVKEGFDGLGASVGIEYFMCQKIGEASTTCAAPCSGATSQYPDVLTNKFLSLQTKLGAVAHLPPLEKVLAGHILPITGAQTRKFQTLDESTSGAERLITIIVDAIRNGGLVQPFCLAEVCGVARIGLVACNGIALSVDFDVVTVGDFLSLFGTSSSDPALDMLGIQNTIFALVATPEFVRLSAYGSPLVGSTTGDGFAKLVADATALLVLEANVTLYFGGSMAGMVIAEFSYGLAPDTSDNFIAIVDVTGRFGPRVFCRIQFPIPSLSKFEMFTGMDYPLRICVQGCFGSRESRHYLYFTGTLQVILSNTQQSVEGEVRMEGWWWNVLYIPFVHVRDLIAGIEFDMKGDGLPTGLIAGGTICLGRQKSCENRVGYFSEIRTYFGLDAVAPDDNFFVAMRSEYTFRQMLGLFFDIFALDSLMPLIPKELADTGLYPYSEYEDCVDEYARTSTPDKMNRNCYIFVSYSGKPRLLPFKDHPLSIPMGLAVIGRLNLFGWKMSAYILLGPPTYFRIDVDMDHIALPTESFPLIRIGRELVDKKAVGGATFHFLMGLAPPSLLANISGAFDIPLLQAYGEGRLILNSHRFEYAGRIRVFDGLWSTYVNLSWKWDFSYLEFQFEDMPIIPIISIINVHCILNKEDRYVLISAHISAFMLVHVSGSLEYSQDEVRRIRYDASANVVVGYAHLWGTIELADSISDWSVTVHFTIHFSLAAVKEFVQTIVRAVVAVVKFVVETWNRIVARIEWRWHKITAIAKREFTDMADALVEGHFIDAMHHFFHVVAAAFDFIFGVIKDIVKIIAHAIADIIFKILGGHVVKKEVRDVEEDGHLLTNAVGCKMQRVWVKSCTRIFHWCKWDHGDPFPETQCMNRKTVAADIINQTHAELVRFNNTRTLSQAENPGIVLADGQLGNLAQNIQLNELIIGQPDSSGMAQGQVDTSVPVMVTASSQKFHVLDTENGSPFQDTPAQVTHHETFVFSNSMFAGLSVQQAQGHISGKMTDDLLNGQGNLRQGDVLPTALVSLSPPILGSSLPFVLRCDKNISLGELAPPIIYAHPLCGNGIQVVLEQRRELPAADFPGHVCGSHFYSLSWRAYDHRACGQESSVVEQNVTSLPALPIFVQVPGPVTITTGQTLDPSGLGFPVGKTPCGHKFNTTFHDDPPVRIACGKWIIQRTWTLTLLFDDLQCVLPDETSTSATQLITVIDQEAPYWIFVPPPQVEVPFFENYQAISSLPLAEEIAHPDMLALGLVSYPVKLSSRDGVLRHSSTAPEEEETCRNRGIAAMNRTWIATDACGNSRTFEQLITLQYPPSVPVPLQTWDPEKRLFAYAPGIEPLASSCNPGKQVLGGWKSYLESYGPPTANDSCIEDGWWSPNGCREKRWTDLKYYRMEVHAQPPYFKNFPADVNITTDDSLDPYQNDVLGIPSGAAYCGIPFTISFHDAPPVQQSCGVWTIERTWKVQPHFADCGGMEATYPASLTTTQVQLLRISDTRAPQWIYKPPYTIHVPFFSNYAAEDYTPVMTEIGSPEMLALGLSSYPISISFVDEPLAMSSMALERCSEGLALIQRTWTLSDACGNSRGLSQTIVFDHPGDQLQSVQRWRPADVDLALADRDITDPNHLFAYAPGVEQLANACRPGKKVTSGKKTMEPSSAEDFNCSAGLWTPTGCRLGAERDNDTSTGFVYDFPVTFSDFPPDVDINTFTSLSPDVLGRPTGASYCGTPFTISYQDAAPVWQSCGVWTITRTWKLQPHYADCGGAEATYPDTLTTKRVQMIVVNDRSPPRFIQTPAQDRYVEFLEDYGTSVTGVPLVEDVAEDSEMAALGLSSYPITLAYEDTNVLFFTGQASHKEGMAVLSRLWTTKDACANTATWLQTIRVRNPSSEGGAGPLGKIGNFTVFAAQEVQAHNTVVKGSIGSYSKVLLQGTVADGNFSYITPQYIPPNDTITTFSEKLLTFRPRLFVDKPNPRTGPTAIKCTGIPQYTCKVISMAVPPKTNVSYDKFDNMTLEGDGLLYNIFNDVEIDQWRYTPPRVALPNPPKQIIRAEGFIIINIMYSDLDASKTMLRESVFEQRFPAGAPFVLYNLKNIPEQPIRNMALRNTKLAGSLLSQDSWNELNFENTTVTGQVFAVNKRITLNSCLFQGCSFPPNYLLL